jgi:hypothetical protein
LYVPLYVGTNLKYLEAPEVEMLTDAVESAVIVVYVAGAAAVAVKESTGTINPDIIQITNKRAKLFCTQAFLALFRVIITFSLF